MILKLSESFGMFRKVSENLILRENGYCMNVNQCVLRMYSFRLMHSELVPFSTAYRPMHAETFNVKLDVTAHVWTARSSAKKGGEYKIIIHQPSTMLTLSLCANEYRTRIIYLGIYSAQTDLPCGTRRLSRARAADEVIGCHSFLRANGDQWGSAGIRSPPRECSSAARTT